MRTAQEIVDETNEVARRIYKAMGYVVPEGTDFHTEKPNRHPQEVMCWELACDIQGLLTRTDVENALAELE
jgi:hypothetical protein